MTSRSLRSILSLEALNDRIVPSGANGAEFGTGTLPLVQELQADGTNLGLAYCQIEQGDCAVDTIEFIQPPGQG